MITIEYPRGRSRKIPSPTAASWWPAGDSEEVFDAARKQYVNLIEAGIIDTAKVAHVALENAVSVAGTLLLTEATMIEIPEESRDRLRPPESIL